MQTDQNGMTEAEYANDDNAAPAWILTALELIGAVCKAAAAAARMVF